MSSPNGQLTNEAALQVREALAGGGLPGGQRRFQKACGGDLPDAALARGNRDLGELYDDRELQDVAAGDHSYLVNKEVARLRATREARAKLATEGVSVPEFPTGTLVDALKVPARELVYAVDELLPAD